MTKIALYAACAMLFAAGAQAQSTCTYTFSAIGYAFNPNGSLGGTLDLMTQPGCAWTSTTSTPWILAGTSGTGSAAVLFKDEANTTGATRKGTVTVGGTTLNISQAASTCTFSLSFDPTATVITIPAAGQTSPIAVTTQTGCVWFSTSNVPWLTFAGALTSGSGGVNYTSTANTTGAIRTGTVAIGAFTINVSQAPQAVTPPSTPPAIGNNGVVNSASFSPALSVGGAVAQGSIFSIFGSALGPNASPALTSFPLSTTLGGVSVQVISGTTSVNAIPVYVSPTLINAIMPSNAPLGRVSVQVTYNTSPSNMAPVTVAANAPGIYTATGAGIGPGILQNFTANGVPTNSARASVMPGQTAVLWLTGLGAITAPDNQAPPVGSLSYPVEIWIGGQLVTNIAYSGRTPCCAGVDEIVFTVPANASTGCFVPVTMRVAGKAVSNTVTVAVDPAGAPCSDPISGNYTKGGTFGTVVLGRRAIRVDSASPPDLITDVLMAGFSQEAGADFSYSSLSSLPPAGSCTVTQGVGNYLLGDSPFSTNSAKGLQAGSLAVKGPSGSFTAMSALDKTGANEYLALLGSAGVLQPGVGPAPFLAPGGPYTITGSGGADVGAFSVALTVPSNSISWTNRDQLTTVDHTQPLTFNWTGTSYLVSVEGIDYDVPTNISTAFRCVAPAGATSFTVPAYVLANMALTRPNPYESRSLIGILAATAPVTFQATGLNYPAAYYVLQQSRSVTFK